MQRWFVDDSAWVGHAGSMLCCGVSPFALLILQHKSYFSLVDHCTIDGFYIFIIISVAGWMVL
jgi:hypothetical protein